MCGQNHLSHFQAEYQPDSGVALPAICPKAMGQFFVMPNTFVRDEKRSLQLQGCRDDGSGGI